MGFFLIVNTIINSISVSSKCVYLKICVNHKESVSPDTGKHQEEESFKESGRRHSTSDVPQKGASPPKRGPPPGLRIFSPVDSDDLEVETVLSDGKLGYRFCYQTDIIDNHLHRSQH